MLSLVRLGPDRVTLPANVSDGRWHSVEWRRTQKNFSLTLDGSVVGRGLTPGDYFMLNVGKNGVSYVHVGGVVDYSLVSNQGTHACMSSLFCVSNELVVIYDRVVVSGPL